MFEKKRKKQAFRIVYNFWFDIFYDVVVIRIVLEYCDRAEMKGMKNLELTYVR